MIQLSSRQKQSGFTLIELIMVIIMLGILSAGAVGIFSSKGSYASFVAKDQFLSHALLAQQLALGMSGTTEVSNPVTLSIGVDSGGAWEMIVKKLGEQVSHYVQESSNATLRVDGATILAGSSVTFTWNRYADLAGGINHQLVFSGEKDFRICLSVSGYAYEPVDVCP